MQDRGFSRNCAPGPRLARSPLQIPPDTSVHLSSHSCTRPTPVWLAMYRKRPDCRPSTNERIGAAYEVRNDPGVPALGEAAVCLLTWRLFSLPMSPRRAEEFRTLRG